MSFIDLFDDYIAEIRCVDIGAMIQEIDETDNHDYRMSVFFQHPKVTVIGFEPQQDKCAELNEQFPNHVYLPYAVGDGTTRAFHITKSAPSSSFFPADRSIIDAFQLPRPAFKIRDTIEMDTIRLDDVEEAKNCDFLKIDAEGAEVMILENARAVMESCTVTQLEASFIPYREGAPTFSDVDHTITAAGFMFHQMAIMGVNFAPWSIPGQPLGYISQMLLGDMIYVKDFRSFQDMETERLFKAAAILHDIYLAADLCSYILRIIDEREKLNTAQIFGRWYVAKDSAGRT